MYLPASFSVDDPAHREALALQVIEEHPFATLVSQSDGQPFASHCPMRAGASSQRATGAGLMLEGHLAAANPQWRAWTQDTRVLAVFHGPHAYVSPAHYEARRNVPTWNYVAVHVTGRVHWVDGRAARSALLERLINALEPAFLPQWRALDDSWRDSMLDNIVAFQLLPEKIEAKFKLSQNRSEVDRSRVQQAFEAGTPQERALADWMRRLGTGG